MRVPNTRAATLSACVLALAATAWWAGAAWTEDEKPVKPLTPAQMEAKCMELSGKAVEHERLKQLAGTWTCTGTVHTISMGDMPVRGRSVNQLVLGGRFLQMDYEGPGPAGTLQGTGHMGYDRQSRTYQSTWMMSLGTTIDVMAGTFDADTHTFELRGAQKMIDDTVWHYRETLQIVDADTLVEKQYVTPAGGKEMPSLELTYKRDAMGGAK
jgi:hypothetical protein